MTDLESAKAAIESTYNNAISVFDYGNYIRFTNGSAAYYVDIRLSDGQFTLNGQRYGERINTSCEATEQALIDTLQATV